VRHAASLQRLLRALTNLGIFAEQPDGRFAQTPMSDALRSDVPYSMRGTARMVNRPWSIRAWIELEHSVRTGESAFEHVHGKQGFDYMLEHLEMLVITHGGKERTLEEWKQLLDASGFRFSRVVPTAAPVSVIEAIR
jgi:C-methyltransferase